jgi:hypothetical protein
VEQLQLQRGGSATSTNLTKGPAFHLAPFVAQNAAATAGPQMELLMDLFLRRQSVNLRAKLIQLLQKEFGTWFYLQQGLLMVPISFLQSKIQIVCVKR